MYYAIGFLIVILIFLLFIYFMKKNKKSQKNIKKRNHKYKKPNFKKKEYDRYNVIPESFLTCKIDGEDNFLTWRYSGENIRNKKTYMLTLLPYKNKQNEFKIHINDHHYLKYFYMIYNLYDCHTDCQISNQIIAESDYNVNKEQYLELEKTLDDKYYVRASLWSEKGPNAYLHLDDKNKLYFDQGINKNIIAFDII